MRTHILGIGRAFLALALCGSLLATSCGGKTERPEPQPCEDGPDTTCIGGCCTAPPLPCEDADGDGAGIGPACAADDCDDSDPTIPDEESCSEPGDQDCDGVADEGCICPIGTTRPCGGQGACAGVQACTSNGWGTECAGASQPLPSEVCGNAVDENCNGEMNEGCCPPGEQPCPGYAICSTYGECPCDHRDEGDCTEAAGAR
jgi:hypothetical protein